MIELTFTSLTSLLRLYGLQEEQTSHATSFFGTTEGTYLSATFPRPLASGAQVAQQALRIAERTGMKQWCWAQPGSATAQACWAMGATQAPAVALMSLAPGQFAPDPESLTLPGDMTLRWVDDAHSCQLFRDLHRAALPPGAEATPAWAAADVFASDQVLLHPQVRACLLLVADCPASAGYAVEWPSACAVHWVVTSAAHQRRGLATYLMRHLLAACSPELPIILQSTLAGFGLYRRLGFASAGLIDRWLVKPVPTRP